MNDFEDKNNDNEVVSQPDVLTDQGEAEFTDSLSVRLSNLEADFKDQRQENNNIIIGVLVASVLIVVVVAIEVIIFHTNSREVFYLQSQPFQEQIFKSEINQKNSEIKSPESDLDKSES